MASSEVMVPVISLLLDDNPPVAAYWGAEPVVTSFRPDRNWMSQFDGISAINVANNATDLDDALDQCADGQPCVIAIDQLVLSETIYLDRPKTKLLGLAANKITMTDTDNDGGAFIQIERGAQEILITNLQLDGASINYEENGVVGILVEGHIIQNIALLDNNIHHLNSTVAGGGGGAHGIAVYGDGSTEQTAISNILIEGNRVHHMRTGSSESIVVNGNVRNWAIRSNNVEHINNIAIDAIGGEGTVPPPAVASGERTLPHPLDAARYGFIENNTVTDMSTVGNPDYGSVHSYAGGIYIDGAHHILISGNTVNQAEWAYDVGAENCVTTRHISLINNTANQSYYGDIILGGYAAQGYLSGYNNECNPLISQDNNEGHGNVDNITVKNNVLNSIPTAPPTGISGNIHLDNRIHQSIIIQTGISAEHPDGNVSGDQRSIRITE